jgi:homoserine dehydrogenase
MNIALIGFGNVGQGFAAILRDKANDLHAQYGFDGKIVAVATGSRGTLYDPKGLDINALLIAIETGDLSAYPESATLERNWIVQRIATESNADAVVEVSPTNLQTGQPALDICYAALDSGKHVVLANKGPVAVAYHDLMKRAQAANKLVRFEATVMAGTPSIRLALQVLAGCKITSAKGILNGTTNYILTQMEGGMAYGSALQQAQELGYAETDPSGDVDGWDAAGKAIILGAALFGKQWTLDDLDVTGISGISSDDVAAAKQAGERWKLIATVTPEGGVVRPVRLSLADPLAGVGGATNAITYASDLMGDVTLIGAGAGRKETGFAALADLLDIHRLT